MLANAYDCWDKFNFEKALSIFKALRGNEYLSGWGIKSKIENNKNFLYKEIYSKKDDKKNNNFYCKERLFDLYLNANRRIKEGKYDDAMARFYRLFEYIAQIRLFNREPQIITGDVNVSSLPEKIRGKYINMKGENDKKITLSLVRSYELLKELNDEVGITFFKDYKNGLEKLLNKRNNSILAHGFDSIAEKDVIEIKNLVEKYLNIIDSDWKTEIKNAKFPELKIR